jgi:hypothetical protein
VGKGVLGIAAARQERADPVVGLPLRNVRADGLNRARHFETEGLRRSRGRGIAAGALDQVRSIYTCRPNPDQNLVGAGRRFLDFGDNQRLSDHGFHRLHHGFGHFRLSVL